MLKDLRIKNFIIIKEQEITFDAGLSVITGETGAGKSIILKALSLLLGGRPKSSFIRKGENSFLLEANFDLRQWSDSMIEDLPEIARAKELILCRTMNQDGRGKVYINGKQGTVNLLEEIAAKLMSICGQGEHVALLNPNFHVNMIDSYGDYSKSLNTYQKLYKEWNILNQKISTLKNKGKERALKEAQLNFIIEELEPLNLYPGVREELEEDIKRLESAYSILDEYNKFSDILLNDSGLLVNLDSLARVSNSMESSLSEFSKISETIESVKAIVNDLEIESKAVVKDIEVDEKALEEKRGYLSEIARVERKYNLDTAGLIDLYKESKKELDEFVSDESLDSLIAEFSKIEDELNASAKELSSERAKSAKVLSKKLCKELSELNMPSVKFELKQTETSTFTVNGKEEIEFFIATNKGEDLKPLRKIASGGEMSRIILVLKKLLKEKHGVNVLIFDEVDTGISGSVARAVGEKLKDLSKYSQVICITHLAQVASLADTHFLVEKEEKNRAVSSISKLDSEARVEEIARMLAGYKLTSATRESARELLSS